MSAHSIGGPACRIVRSEMSGSRSRAAPTPTRRGCAESIRSTASSFARAIASAPRASPPPALLAVGAGDRLGLEGEPRERVLGARLRWPPLDALDGHALALELVGEQ